MKVDSDAELLELPKVAVLLATYNGAQWLGEQIDSINAQTGVSLRVIVSDDASGDETLPLLASTSDQDSRWTLLPTKNNSGSSNANFMRLIRDADIEDAQYIAFSDQDDVWFSNKMSNAISMMRAFSAQGYSSSVIAMYSDGSQSLVDKAQPQRKYDHFFESPGPGCTIAVDQSLFKQIRSLVIANAIECINFSHHDWLIYAYARANNLVWHIDMHPSMLYRQHQNNVVGVNQGATAFRSRIKKIRNGWYRDQILALCKILSSGNTNNASILEIQSLLQERPSVLVRIKFILNIATQSRRHLRDRIMFISVASIGWLWNHSKK